MKEELVKKESKKQESAFSYNVEPYILYKAIRVFHNQNNILINAPDLKFLGTSIDQKFYKYNDECPCGILLTCLGMEKAVKKDLIAVVYSEIVEGYKYKQACFIEVIVDRFDLAMNLAKINNYEMSAVKTNININIPFIPQPEDNIIIDYDDAIIFYREGEKFSTEYIAPEKAVLFLKFYLNHITEEELE
ncbi:hypothetical protein ACFL23_00260 [Patescibacteria group bacterium]